MRKSPFFLISLRAETAIKLSIATEDFNKMREALIEIMSFILTLMLFKTRMISYPGGTLNEKNVKAALFLYSEQVQ